MTTMSTTPTHTPRGWTSPHTTLQPRSQHRRTTSRGSARTPASVGQNMPPFQQQHSSENAPRTPAVERLQHQQHVRTPSPNYFGLTVDPAKDHLATNVGHHAKTNWSPPSSQVRSAAAASPRTIPVDQNPDFDGFRRGIEMCGGDMSSFNMNFQSGPGPTLKFGGPDGKSSKSGNARGATSPLVQESSEYKTSDQNQRSPKRLLSSPAAHITDRPRRNSPAGFSDRDFQNAPSQSQQDDRALRMSLPPSNPPQAPTIPSTVRADTLPASAIELSPSDSRILSPVFVTAQHVVNLLEAQNEDILLLDVRVSTQYAKSSIFGALNLCTPTTLLKRPSYNVNKLADCFTDAEQRKKFEGWKHSKYIIAYDANSSQLKDATSCIYTLKKFSNEGWSGFSYIIRGGFFEFSKKFPALIAHRKQSSTSQATQSMSVSTESAVAVVGGCPLPATKSAANPFFGNIRQNMDLIGGVGQMPVKLPASLSEQRKDTMPVWLRVAADDHDHGKAVADKFLQIEKREQKRMQQALSSKVSYGTPGSESTKSVKIAGVEKGTKNRYNNIWPYEHTRVRLEDVSHGDCDYINASYIKASWSNKRYIATQGPLPETFSDFWNAVWQQDVRVIVMLTAEKEGGQLKAHNYWEDKHYGAFTLSFLSEQRASLEPTKINRHRERSSIGRRRSTNPVAGVKQPPELASPASDQPYVIVRRFTLSNSNEPFSRIREITQLQYSNWPDFGAPAHPAHLLGLVEQCDAVVRASQGSSPPRDMEGPLRNMENRPVLVHCSAGCGRTGTFCTVDSVIDMLKRQRRHQNARQATPMEIDFASPSKQLQNKQSDSAFPNLQASEQATPGEDSSFFGNQDYSWLGRDDLDLVEKTVEEFRLQRLSMVQSLRQFVLCYESVIEWLAEQTPKSA